MNPTMTDAFPPPARRIVLDRTPTIVDPPAEPIVNTPIDEAVAARPAASECSSTASP